MLYLNRKLGESIIIDNKIEVQVVEIKGKNVKLGFAFPKEHTVLRKEIHEKISQENQAALHFTPDTEYSNTSFDKNDEETKS